MASSRSFIVSCLAFRSLIHFEFIFVYGVRKCWSFGQSNQSRKRNKRNPYWKRRKLSLFADDMILYIEKHKDTTRNLLELINEYSKVLGYKINTQKSFVFPYSNNEKTEIKETIPFTIVMKRITYVGKILPKETKDLCIKNYETLMKKSFVSYLCHIPIASSHVGICPLFDICL